MAEQLTDEKTTPTLKLNFFSHATLESKAIKRTRQFFEEFLGFETVQMADVAFWSRLGGSTVIVVVEPPAGKKPTMGLLGHNGLDVATDVDVDEAHGIVKRDAKKWGLSKITKPVVQHGSYGFFFWDMDDNCWEILSNPKGGYSWGFERGDQFGAGHTAKDYDRPDETVAKGDGHGG